MRKLMGFLLVSLLMSSCSSSLTTKLGQYSTIKQILRNESYFDPTTQILIAFIGTTKAGEAYVNLSQPTDKEPQLKKWYVGNFHDYSFGKKNFRLYLVKSEADGKYIEISILEQQL